jgi:hypothetical protein
MKLRLTTDGAQFKPSDDDTSSDPQHVAISAMQGLDIDSDGNVLDQQVSQFIRSNVVSFLIIQISSRTEKLTLALESLNVYCLHIIIR